MSGRTKDRDTVFSLSGILPAHGVMGAFFTATSMIGLSLMVGEVASLLLSRMTVPILFYITSPKR